MFFPVRVSMSSRRVPILTLGIILANVVAFWHEIHLPLWEVEPFIARYATIPSHFHPPDRNAILSVFSSMFLHGGFGHIFGNMWFLWIFGAAVEGRLGRMKFLAFYFLSGVAADAAHILAAPNSAVPALGASGAISGVLGAYLFLFPSAEVTCKYWLFSIRPRTVDLPAIGFLGLWIGMQVASALSGTEGGIAWYAHIGGFACGMLLAIILNR